MLIIPSIDIMRGKCVQLVQGKPNTAKSYGDPVEFAERFGGRGAKLLHIVDLDAAFGTGQNLEVIRKIREAVSCELQVGGGVRSVEKLGELLGVADRVVVATLVLEGYPRRLSLLERLARTFGEERLVLAVDTLGREVVVRGWRVGIGVDPIEVVRKTEVWVWGFLHTSVGREGLMSGADIESTRRIVEASSKPVIAAGGVADLQDLKRLRAVGAWGAIVGRALYERKLKLTSFEL